MAYSKQAPCRSTILWPLALVFLTGAAVGMLTMALGAHRWTHQQRATLSWTEGGKEITLQRFTKELDLNAQQTRELEVILDDFMKYYHTLQAQLNEVRSDGKNRILRVLNEEQRRKFEKMMSDLPSQQLR